MIWLRIVGVIIVVLLLIGIYGVITTDNVHRCQYSEATHETECYDPR